VGDQQIKIAVCHLGGGDDPFIYAVRGMATLAVLDEIEAELLSNSDDHLDKGAGEYLFTASYIEGQYGEFGRCELPPGWELSQDSFAAAPPAEGAARAQTTATTTRCSACESPQPEESA